MPITQQVSVRYLSIWFVLKQRKQKVIFCSGSAEPRYCLSHASKKQIRAFSGTVHILSDLYGFRNTIPGFESVIMHVIPVSKMCQFHSLFLHVEQVAVCVHVVQPTARNYSYYHFPCTCFKDRRGTARYAKNYYEMSIFFIFD